MDNPTHCTPTTSRITYLSLASERGWANWGLENWTSEKDQNVVYFVILSEEWRDFEKNQRPVKRSVKYSLCTVYYALFPLQNEALCIYLRTNRRNEIPGILPSFIPRTRTDRPGMKHGCRWRKVKQRGRGLLLRNARSGVLCIRAPQTTCASNLGDVAILSHFPSLYLWFTSGPTLSVFNRERGRESCKIWQHVSW